MVEKPRAAAMLPRTWERVATELLSHAKEREGERERERERRFLKPTQGVGCRV